MKKAKLSGLWLLPFFYLSFCLNETVLRAATARRNLLLERESVASTSHFSRDRSMVSFSPFNT